MCEMAPSENLSGVTNNSNGSPIKVSIRDEAGGKTEASNRDGGEVMRSQVKELMNG